MLFTGAGSARLHTPTIRLDMSSASIPLYVQITLTIGIAMSGKMSVGVVKIEVTPKIEISRATLTNVYGLFRAKRTIHIGPSPHAVLQQATYDCSRPVHPILVRSCGPGNSRPSSCYRSTGSLLPGIISNPVY